MDDKVTTKRMKRLVQRKKKMRKIILSVLLVLMSILIISIIFTKHSSQKITPTKEIEKTIENDVNLENIQEIKVEEEKVTIDNGGYLPYGEDENSEDAISLYKTTDSLLKAESAYPVRTDGKKVVYLTFDDGPSVENTADVLNILKRYGVKATFFVTGVSLEKGEEPKRLLKRIVREGHAVGNHTYSHDYDYLYPNGTVNVENFITDIEKNNELIKSVLGKDFSTRIIRFPGGSWSWKGRSSIVPLLEEKGFAIIDWNTLNQDAEGEFKDAAKLVERTKENVEILGSNADNIIFLMHDTYGKRETVKALPEIIEYFKCSNFIFKTIK